MPATSHGNKFVRIDTPTPPPWRFEQNQRYYLVLGPPVYGHQYLIAKFPKHPVQLFLHSEANAKLVASLPEVLTHMLGLIDVALEDCPSGHGRAEAARDFLKSLGVNTDAVKG